MRTAKLREMTPQTMGELEAVLRSWTPEEFAIIFEDEIAGLNDARVTTDRIFGGRAAVGAHVQAQVFKGKGFHQWVLDVALIYMEFGPYIGRHVTLANRIVRSASHLAFAEICTQQRKRRIALEADEAVRIAAEAEEPEATAAPEPTKAPHKEPKQEGITLRTAEDVFSDLLEESESSEDVGPEEAEEAPEESESSEDVEEEAPELESESSGDDQENSSSE